MTIAVLATAVGLMLVSVPSALAGEYYVYACSSYGNTAPAFRPYTNADHLTPANGCMQPAPGGGYRSLELNNPGPRAPVAHGYGANWTATTPSPAISIVGAYTPLYTVFVDCYLHTDGFTAQYFWSGGSQAIDHVNGCNSYGYGYGTGINISFAPSRYFGWGAGCWLVSSCATSSSIGAVLGVQGIRLTAQENTGPTIVADGTDNLWYQSGHWVRGGGWPVTFTASDPSGVCGTDFIVNGAFTPTDLTNDSNPDTSSFLQCWSSDTATGTFTTAGLANGPFAIMYAARNAAGVVSNPAETLHVDNTPVSLSLSAPDDPDPNLWVDHAVNVVAHASAGPSGIAGTSCSTNSGRNFAYPSTGITLDGTGVWKVSCSSWNNAYDVNGQPARSSAAGVTVHIDETPPAVSFDPRSPDDPEEVAVATSDAQSGVAGGQIQMRPASGGSWNSLATRFDGSHLIAHFDDSELESGNWVIQTTSCDNAGNCASTQQSLTLPVRTASRSNVSFARIAVAAKRCTVAKRHHQVRCHAAHVLRKARDRVRFGRPSLLHGLLTTGQGAPLGNVLVQVLAAPLNGLLQYREVTTVRTNPAGAWTAVLPPGPSRLISARYPGSPTVQPSSAHARLTVPASVKVLRVWPRRVPWGGKVHIKARLLGGFLPPGGALVRLRLGYGNAKITYGVRTHVGGNGTFMVTNTFGPGPPGLVRHYWLQECTLPESNYPYAPACGPRTSITVGVS